MSSNDSESTINFSLVYTYIPALLMLLRASGLFCLCSLLMALFSSRPTVVVAGVLLAVYVDCFCTPQHDRLSKACGFLAPPALCLLLNANIYASTACTESSLASTLFYINSICWSCTSSFVCVNHLLNLKFPHNDTLLLLMWSGNAIIHLVVQCEKETIAFLIARCIAFYFIAISHWFAQVLMADVDRNSFCHTVLHTATHLLFVHIYMLITSVLIFCIVVIYCMRTKMISTTDTPAIVCFPASASHTSQAQASIPHENTTALLTELRAAKQRAQSAAAKA